MALADLEHVARTQDVGLPPLARCAFQGGYVLEGGRVEHELRAMVGPDLVEAVGVADVGDHRAAE